MAWGDKFELNTAVVAPSAPTLGWTPFDARLHTPMVKPVPAMPTMIDEDIPVVDQRQRERDEVKLHLQSILRNRLLSESARVAAARELTRILDNEEIEELREEVKRLTAIIETSADDSEQLPPSLRGRR